MLTRATTRSLRTHLRLETLETRETPAGGIVTASIALGSLTLKGDGVLAGNHIELYETDQPGLYDLYGVNGTLVRLGTAGSPTPVIRNLAFNKNILATFGTGNDYAAFYLNKSWTQIDDITLNMGAGNDTVGVGGARARNLTVNQAAPASNSGLTDNDQIGIYAGGGVVYTQYGFRGNVTLNNMAGSDRVSLGLSAAGNVVVNASGGGDTIELAACSIGGSLKISESGSSTNSPTIVQFDLPVNIGRDLAIQLASASAIALFGVTVGGNVNVSARATPPNQAGFYWHAVHVGGSLSITLGGERDVIRLSHVRTGKNLTIQTGQGGDSVDLVDLVVGGMASISTGAVPAGSEFAATYISFSGTNRIGNDLRIGMGTPTPGAYNSFAMYDMDGECFIGGHLSVIGSAGTDYVTLFRCYVCGTTVIDVGIGDDGINVGYSTFHNDVTARLGAGDDHYVAEATDFMGNLNLNFGAGLDALRIGRDELWSSLYGQFKYDAGLEVIDIGLRFRMPGISF
jgi:hypothetical protein